MHELSQKDIMPFLEVGVALPFIIIQLAIMEPSIKDPQAVSMVSDTTSLKGQPLCNNIILTFSYI